MQLASYPGLPMFSTHARKSGRTSQPGDVIRCSLRRGCVYYISTHFVGHVVRPWPYPLCGWVGGDMQPHLITSPDQPGLPDFSHVHWKTWESLDMRLCAVASHQHMVFLWEWSIVTHVHRVIQLLYVIVTFTLIRPYTKLVVLNYFRIYG